MARKDTRAGNTWQDYAEAYKRLGNIYKVAEEFDVHHSSVARALHNAARKGNLVGYGRVKPEVEIVPPGHTIVKNTLEVGEEGEVKRQWIRVVPEAEELERLADALCERVAGKAGRIRPASKAPASSLNEVIVGDPHAGMYAWALETGTDYDLDIFKRLHTEGPAMLCDKMKDAEEGVYAVLGDLFHADNMKTTEKSGNVLDVDGRFGKVIDVTIAALCAAIDDMAKRVKKLTVVVIPGNHDRLSSQWAQRILRAYYQDTKHVDVIVSPRNRVYLHRKSVLLGYHHGDRMPANRLQMVMAQEKKEEWGATSHRYWRCGHIHNAKRYRPMWDKDEAPGVIVEYFPVLAGLEAYAAEAGYSARRAIVGVQHHTDYGEIGRSIITPEMIGG